MQIMNNLVIRLEQSTMVREVSKKSVLDDKAVGRRIKSWIFDSGATKEEFAKSFGVPGRTVTSWIRGEVTIPLPRAAQLCEYFDKSLDELVRREEWDENYRKRRSQLP